MKTFLSLLASLVITFNSLAFQNVPEKYLVSTTLVKSHTKKSIKELWKKKHIPAIALPVNCGVDIYEIIYKAPWIDSTTWINCSGIVYIPKVEGKKVPTVMFGHGTEIRKGRNITDDDAQQNICLGFATDRYLALYPDYYGIGKGDGQHLYQHAWSEGMAFLYMLYAVEELKQQLQIQTNGQLFLTGYSQGGHASMAAHKYIELAKDPRFVVTASSPMSGAYDMTGEQSKYMFQEYPRPFYLPYLLISYQKAYNILDSSDPFSVFKAPYDTLLPNFFGEERNKSYSELDKIMPKIPKDIVRDDYIHNYVNDPCFSFRLRLEENNLTQWKPEAPVQLCYCKGDKEVNYKNSEVAYAGMRSMGAPKVKLDNESDYLDHNTCAAFTVLASKNFFDRYKKHGKNPKMKNIPAFKRWIVNMVKRKVEKQFKESGKDRAYI
ncbi:MAG: hypothetical protein K1X82_09470 [Bacteroidia bacterium]|nr:hypothetical protein [Bacteroidia bacterium]